MASLKVAAVVLLCYVASASAEVKYHSVTLNDLKPAKISVNVTFIQGGLQAEALPPCFDQKLNAPCLPKLFTGNESEGIVIQYAPQPGVTFLPTEKIQLKLCYANESTLARPWRKGNPQIGRSRQCPWVIRAGLNATAGTYTWRPLNETLPVAVYFVRAYTLTKSPDAQIVTPLPTAYGDSVGFFQVGPHTDLPTKMKIAVGVCIPIGPILLISYLTYDLKFRKKTV